ncbi:MAG: hypothetical protein HQM13_14190 [SAR324 cluster bacterium]|nr:hypothetical protein [SAR324 cluster bacterium]
MMWLLAIVLMVSLYFWGFPISRIFGIIFELIVLLVGSVFLLGSLLTKLGYGPSGLTEFSSGASETWGIPLFFFVVLIIVRRIFHESLRIEEEKELPVDEIRLSFLGKLAKISYEECQQHNFDGFRFRRINVVRLVRYYKISHVSLEEGSQLPVDDFSEKFQILLDMAEVIPLEHYYSDFESIEKDLEILAGYDLKERKEELNVIMQAFKTVRVSALREDPQISANYHQASNELSHLKTIEKKRDKEIFKYREQQAKIIKRAQEDYLTTKNLGSLIEYHPSYEKASVVEELINLSQSLSGRYEERNAART